MIHPAFYVNHGGGPCFFMDGPMRDGCADLEAYLRMFAGGLDERPTCILVVSAHWEQRRPTVVDNNSSTLMFDYSGFPPHTYELTYPAPGSRDVAGRVRELLSDAGIETGADADRGWDHGVFVPLKVMFPHADIPVVQLSLQAGLDPRAHLLIGEALRPLRSEGVLIVGSGMSYHNMRGLGTSDPAFVSAADEFDSWLRTAIADPDARNHSLAHWEDAPGARSAHPREEHLLPLMVVAGAAAGDHAAVDFRADVLGKPTSGFRFDSNPRQGDPT